jgi:hypothetical protein
MSAATQRLQPRHQTLDEAYAPPANFLEIEVTNPITHGVGKTRYTDYEIRMRVGVCSAFVAVYQCGADKFTRVQAEGVVGATAL